MEKFILLALVLLSNVNFYSQNLVLNGGLENWSSGTPDNWIIENGNISQETIIISEGTSSALFSPQSPNPFIPPTSSITQDFVIDISNEYKLTFDYFVPDTSINNPIDLISYSLNKSSGAPFFLTTSGSFTENSPSGEPLVRGSWSPVESESFKIQDLFMSGETTATISLVFIVGASFGDGDEKAYIDNVSILPVNPSLNISEFNTKKEESTFIYPNPTSDFLFFRKNKNIKEVKLFNAFGKLIRKEKILSDQNSIDIKDISSGIYFIELLSNNSSVKETHKFLKR